ncbi:MAG: TIM barrel protein [Victivallaceae bacterium]|nr:TIM barrel protein [Victivallaceae bacterium]
MSCVTDRSMPFWCVGNPLSDPFGGAVMDKISSVEVAKILAWAKGEKLIECTSFHDDDLVPWDPEHLEDDLDSKSSVSKTLHEIKKILDQAGIRVHVATCSLHGNKLFRNGGLCNPDPEIRALAARKVERTLRIGHFFGAKYFVYWVARDGFEVPVCTDWTQVYKNLADGLNHATDYIEKEHLTNYIGASIEPKPNEPRGQMFLPTAGHAAAFIACCLKRPDFWGVNPELLQHESMCLLNASMTAAFLCATGKLKFLHFGSQIKAQFDNDFPPLIGPEGLKETVFLFKTLQDLHWKGVVEFDCHMLRAEGEPGEGIARRKQFVRNCVEALQMAETLAERIKAPKLGSGAAAADLESIRQMCNL